MSAWSMASAPTGERSRSVPRCIPASTGRPSSAAPVPWRRSRLRPAGARPVLRRRRRSSPRPVMVSDSESPGSVTTTPIACASTPFVLRLDCSLGDCIQGPTGTIPTTLLRGEDGKHNDHDREPDPAGPRTPPPRRLPMGTCPFTQIRQNAAQNYPLIPLPRSAPSGEIIVPVEAALDFAPQARKGHDLHGQVRVPRRDIPEEPT